MPADAAIAAGTAGAAGSGVATGDAGADTQTEDQILGIAEDDGAVSEEVVDDSTAVASDDAAAAETDDAAKAAAAGADELNPDEVPATIPPELKHLMSDAKVAPHIQRMSDQLAAYSKLGTVRDARTFAEEFPGGVKEAQDYKNRALDTADWDAQFESGDPRAQGDLAQSWFEHARAAGRPEVFRSQVSSALEVLKKNDPQGFKQLTGGNVNEALGGELIASDGRNWNMAAQSDAILQAIKEDDMEALKGLSFFLVREMSNMGLGKKEAGGRVPKEQEHLKSETERLTTEKAQLETEKKNFFFSRTNESARAGMERSIRQQLVPILKGKAFSKEGVADIEKQIFAGIEAKLKTDRSYQVQVTNYVRAAKWDPSKNGDLVTYMTNRAKALFAGVAKEVITRETNKFVTASKDASERRKAAGTRVDVTGGQAGSVRRGMPTRQQIQGMTDDQQDELVNARLGT